jgi:hypothetical protein
VQKAGNNWWRVVPNIRLLNALENWPALVPGSFDSGRRFVTRYVGLTALLDAQHQIFARAFHDPAPRGRLLENPDPDSLAGFRSHTYHVVLKSSAMVLTASSASARLGVATAFCTAMPLDPQDSDHPLPP